MMTNYWNSSKLADKIRGTEKPYALTAEDWQIWHKEANEKHPIRYWIAEEFLKNLQRAIYWPYNTYRKIRIFTHNFINRRDILYTDGLIKRGQYLDTNARLELCIMETFCQFMEDELFWLFSNGEKPSVPTREQFVEYDSQYEDICNKADVDGPFNIYTTLYDTYVWWKENREEWWEVTDTPEFDKNLKYIIEHRGVLWS